MAEIMKKERHGKSKWLAAGAVALAAAAILGMGSAVGIYAYQSSAESAVNTITIGEVKIDLVEPNFPGNQSEEVKSMVPNQSVDKDPHIVNTGINDAVVFLEVHSPMWEVTVVDMDTGKKTSDTPSLQEVFHLIDSDGNYLADREIEDLVDGWYLISKEEVTNGDDPYVKYVFGYEDVLKPEGENHLYTDGDFNKNGTAAISGTQTTDLFDQVQLRYIIEGEISSSDSMDIDLIAYAIQANFVHDNQGIDLTDTLDFENLAEIFEIYCNQNEGIEAPEAKKTNSYGIPSGE